MQNIYFVRGAPGSGKTTIANEMVEKHGMVGVEADQFFERDGEYKFNAALLGRAHDWAKKKLIEALAAGKNVVVSNTSTKISEVDGYLKGVSRSVTVTVIDLSPGGSRAKYKNEHGVPADRVKAIVEKFEEFPAGERKGKTLSGKATMPDGETMSIPDSVSYVVWIGVKK